MADASRAHDREIAGRGRLVIHDRVVEAIARTAATEVGGVTRWGSGLDSVVGRRYPKADASTAGNRTRIGLEVAVVWPSALPQVLQQVRERVRTRVGELTGLEVDAVDVLAARIVQDAETEPRRVS